MEAVFLVKVQRVWEPSHSWTTACATGSEASANALIARMIHTEPGMVISVAPGVAFKREVGDTFDVAEVPFVKGA